MPIANLQIELPQPSHRACVPDMLKHMAARWPERDAVVSPGLTVSFTELEQQSARIARGLLERGIGKGSRVGILMPNSPDWVLAFMAVTRIGAVAVPLSTLYQAPELAQGIRHADLHYLIVTDRYHRRDYRVSLEDAFPDLKAQTTPALRMAAAPFLRGVFIWGECDRPWAESWPQAVLGTLVSPELLAAAEAEVTPADALCVLYTSGSTADPKAVMHTHGKAVRHGYGLGHTCSAMIEGDRVATTRPFFWVAGLIATLFYGLQRGVTVVCTKSGSAADILEAVETMGLTCTVGREAWATELFEDPVFQESPYQGVKLDYNYSAIARKDPAAPGGLRWLNPEMEALWPARLGEPAAEARNRHYGMTETLGTFVTAPTLELAPEGVEWTVGHPVPGVEVRIVDPDTGEDTPQGGIGELLLRGGPLMDGMYKLERRDVFDADGYYASGDLVQVDERGYMFVRSRLGEMIKVKGANVAPAEVERWLMTLPGVAEAIVVGAPQAGTPEPLLTAVLIPTPDAQIDEAAVIADLKGKVSAFKVPKKIVVMPAEDLPRTGSGKIVRGKLAAMVGDSG